MQTFEQLHHQLHAEINTSELQDGLVWLTLLNDLGKTKRAKELHAEVMGKAQARIGHDKLMYELISNLELQPYFPGFYSLTLDIRTLITHLTHLDFNCSLFAVLA